MPRAKDEKEDIAEQVQEGLVGDAAQFVQNVPIISHISEMSITHTLRWFLWLMVICITVVGLGACALGTIASIIALGSLSSSLNAPVAGAYTALNDMSAALSSSTGMGANVADGLSSGASSIRNLSIGLAGTSSTLKGLASIPVIGPGLSGLGAASQKIDSAAAEMALAADKMDAASLSAKDAAAKISAVADDFESVAASLEAARRGIAGAMFILQVACIAFGASIMLMLSSTLMLALVVGPPQSKKAEQK